ncbi:MAG TPA: DUF6798 domain-containing protein, partial [Pyrinomonadaceae bacterium]|nr:DUF6798 domain-containing protein [Pyrinomonadaceae bacterium]
MWRVPLAHWANICLILAVLTWFVYRNSPSRPGHWALVKRYADERSDWVEVCRWIGAHGPSGTIYLTPPGNEGVTYLSNRSNVAEFKINPDGGQRLSEWVERLSDLGGGHLPEERGFANASRLNEAFASLDDEQIKALGEKYGAGHAVVSESSRVSFEEIYKNNSYRVVRL